jgi:RNA polymerase primary sigma factor
MDVSRTDRERKRDRPLRSPLEAYLAEIDETRLLTPEQEKELANRIKHGDREARDHMIRANLRLVVKIARTYIGRGLGVPDLIAEGNLGLLRAVETFDPSMNTRFSTYATYWIKHSMKRAVNNLGRMIRIPAYMNELFIRWHRTKARLEEELGRTPTREEIAEGLGISSKKLATLDKAVRIDNPQPQTAESEGDLDVFYGLPDANQRTPEQQLIDAEDVKRAVALLNDLDEREATVLRMRFGLDGGEPMTRQTIGDCLNLTGERVHQIEKKALEKLKMYMTEAEDMSSFPRKPSLSFELGRLFAQSGPGGFCPAVRSGPDASPRKRA